MGKRSDHRKKSKKKWILIPLVVLFVLVLGTAGYGYSILNKTKETVNGEMHEPVDSIDLEMTKEKVDATESLDILLMGIDEREGDKGRSDALLVLSLDPEKDKMQLVSIPRDTRTNIVGKGKEDKINHAYAFGGSDMAVATVEDLLDIELDYYVRMNMEGLSALVDEIGSITVDNEVEWEDGDYDFPEGSIDMDGDKTMDFVRMRKKDPSGDFGRTKRHRQVIEAIVDRGASVGSIPKMDRILDILGDNMATNMDFDDMKKLFSGYRDTRKDIDTYMMEGSGTKIDGIYYYDVSDEEIDKVHDMIDNFAD